MVLGGAAMFIAAFACSAQISPSSGGDARRAGRSGAITESDVRRLLGALSDDSLEGRMTASRGSARAAAVIAAEMRRIGLEPAGDSGYFQRVPIALVDAGRGRRPVLLESFAQLDTLPAAQRPPSVNVVGVLQGSDPAVRDSAVLIDAHYDHLGIGRAVNGDSIYNGADDDASGVVAVLEIARALAAGPKPRRTVIFAATTGEEELTALLTAKTFPYEGPTWRQTAPLVLIDTDYQPFTARPRPEGRIIYLRPAQEHDYLASLAEAGVVRYMIVDGD